ncbi:hypothetical protein [Pantoea septica]|uniref:hypothetical protein n=1 Tax=Pantoea septica TaxID=472695 RepID=UPI001C111757|nr:hypothetical protein [Pantoea septica]MBU5379161.1 hypothetical protein [Pantoea septica]
MKSLFFGVVVATAAAAGSCSSNSTCRSGGAQQQERHPAKVVIADYKRISACEAFATRYLCFAFSFDQG